MAVSPKRPVCIRPGVSHSMPGWMPVPFLPFPDEWDPTRSTSFFRISAPLVFSGPALFLDAHLVRAIPRGLRGFVATSLGLCARFSGPERRARMRFPTNGLPAAFTGRCPLRCAATSHASLHRAPERRAPPARSRPRGPVPACASAARFVLIGTSPHLPMLISALMPVPRMLISALIPVPRVLTRERLQVHSLHRLFRLASLPQVGIPRQDPGDLRRHSRRRGARQTDGAG